MSDESDARMAAELLAIEIADYAERKRRELALWSLERSRAMWLWEIPWMTVNGLVVSWAGS
jgi:hypothetical protein